MSLEKQLLLLICGAFVVVCFGAFMFVPELMEAQRVRPAGQLDRKKQNACFPRVDSHLGITGCNPTTFPLPLEHIGVQTEDHALNGAINQAPAQQDRSHFAQPPDAGAEQAARLEKVRTPSSAGDDGSTNRLRCV